MIKPDFLKKEKKIFLVIRMGTPTKERKKNIELKFSTWKTLTILKTEYNLTSYDDVIVDLLQKAGIKVEVEIKFDQNDLQK